MKRFKTQGGTGIMWNWSLEFQAVVKFGSLCFSSNLICCWKYYEYYRSREKKAVFFPQSLTGWQAGQDHAKLLNYVLSSASLIARCGGRRINQWLTRTKTSVSFQLLASLSICLHLAVLLSLCVHVQTHWHINTYTHTHTNTRTSGQTYMYSTMTHPH